MAAIPVRHRSCSPSPRWAGAAAGSRTLRAAHGGAGEHPQAVARVIGHDAHGIVAVGGGDGHVSVAAADPGHPGRARAPPHRYFWAHRADLLALLAGQLPPGTVRTGHRGTGFGQDGGSATVDFANGATATADVVIGADGMHSVLQGSW